MAYILKASESELVFADSGSWSTVCEAARQNGIGTDRIVLMGAAAEDRGQSDKTSIQDLIAEAKSKSEHGQVEAWTVPKGRSNKEVPAFLSFTSGTTSAPKGVSHLLEAAVLHLLTANQVMISHHNVIAQMMQMRSWTAESCPKVLLGVLPLYHSKSAQLVFQRTSN